MPKIYEEIITWTTKHETFDNPLFFPIIKETQTKSSNTGSGSSVRRVIADKKSTPQQYVKALILARARYGNLMELPYTCEGVLAYDYPSNHMLWQPDFVKWYNELSDLYVKKDDFSELVSAISVIDFDTFDQGYADFLKNKYKKDSTKKVIEIDVETILMEELDENQ